MFTVCRLDHLYTFKPLLMFFYVAASYNNVQHWTSLPGKYPYIYQMLTQNWTHIFTGYQKFALIFLDFFGKIDVKFAQIWEIFSKISRK